MENVITDELVIITEVKEGCGMATTTNVLIITDEVYHNEEARMALIPIIREGGHLVVVDNVKECRKR